MIFRTRLSLLYLSLLFLFSLVWTSDLVGQMSPWGTQLFLCMFYPFKYHSWTFMQNIFEYVLEPKVDSWNAMTGFTSCLLKYWFSFIFSIGICNAFSFTQSFKSCRKSRHIKKANNVHAHIRLKSFAVLERSPLEIRKAPKKAIRKPIIVFWPHEIFKLPKSDGN